MYLTKRELIAIIIIMVIMMIYKSFYSVDEGMVAPTSPKDGFSETSLVTPFEVAPGLILGPPTFLPEDDLTVVDECIDTHNLEEVSCADKAAVVKFRKAMAAEFTNQLKKEIDQMLYELMQDKYGLQEC